jgi:hypothetical protein
LDFTELGGRRTAGKNKRAGKTIGEQPEERAIVEAAMMAADTITIITSIDVVHDKNNNPHLKE